MLSVRLFPAGCCHRSKLSEKGGKMVTGKRQREESERGKEGNRRRRLRFSFRMETLIKSFSLKVDGYSLIKQLQPERENDMVVGTFDLGGHSWAITFLPNDWSYDNWMALHVSLLTETKTTMAL
ncbi:hypothetical protein FCM35_KLT00315 [Carex littledalei]|uniref:MATH domain-containing protein n=1 Tax=Carex littledalei TaxID=544730 RepID=A0A833RLQ9_9POAL|nr:hypothetical protein FCM35_KLT00315 [Carex littledalei]